MIENNMHEVAENEPAMIKKIGKMTYIVKVYFSQTCKENFNDKVKRMLCDEIKQLRA